ncbi:23S rRNA (uracil(1939)-C(5))-methyltransferase RlmD [Pseudolactococcus insecticola]|uniref:Putative RNA methyltransferase n=1 Tax=Pseudolactococcus insecticola TaxID=2709158 RepID=A0A6A0B5W7_9LACT|nr:23S rRNA (uracil(1939)-C(5))-methyltransferase RlmD [Lactococcus insecticola]GFH40632.1 putative RNA methyltransferase [Lactococcus insecticola]
MTLKIKQKIPLKIKKIGINGEGVGNFKGTTVFVTGALKGEDVYAEITSLAPNFATAKVLKLNKKSPHRVVPMCEIYKQCGGCQIMHLAYPQQLLFKQDLLRQALKKFRPEGFETYEVRKTIGMKNPEHYRAKLQFQTRFLGEKVRAGLFAENSHRLVEIKNCLAQDETTQAIITEITELLTFHRIPIYNERKFDGIRTVMVRRAHQTGQVQIIFISSERVELTRTIASLTEKFPEIKTVALNINRKNTSEIYSNTSETEILWGERAILEGVLDYTFELSPRAFYQLNPEQTNTLYTEAVKAMDARLDDDLIDAYSGTGTIGRAFLGKVRSIRGMDVIPESIDDARVNVPGGIYEVGTAESLIPQWVADGFKATALIVDPPRTGLDDKLLDTIVATKPAKMVYVSCNVSTLARDLVKLAQVYDVKYIQSVDMFPHTARTEAVVKLVRK